MWSEFLEVWGLSDSLWSNMTATHVIRQPWLRSQLYGSWRSSTGKTTKVFFFFHKFIHDFITSDNCLWTPSLKLRYKWYFSQNKWLLLGSAGSAVLSSQFSVLHISDTLGNLLIKTLLAHPFGHEIQRWKLLIEIRFIYTCTYSNSTCMEKMPDVCGSNIRIELCMTFWKPCLAEGMNSLLEFLSKVIASRHKYQFICVACTDILWW